MKIFQTALLLCVTLIGATGCDERKMDSDQLQRDQQEKILQEGTSSVGMPAIKNFRERRLVRDIYELRDQDGLTTYTYLYNEMTGKLVFFGETIGYGVPYSAQFSNPEKIVDARGGSAGYHYMAIPQAEPNGLFTPASSSATWVMMKDPNGDKVVPVYVEPLIVVSPFKLNID